MSKKLDKWFFWELIDHPESESLASLSDTLVLAPSIANSPPPLVYWLVFIYHRVLLHVWYFPQYTFIITTLPYHHKVSPAHKVLPVSTLAADVVCTIFSWFGSTWDYWPPMKHFISGGSPIVVFSSCPTSAPGRVAASGTGSFFLYCSSSLGCLSGQARMR